MSYQSALAAARQLGTFYTAHDVRYSIELQPGRPGPPDTWHAARDFRGTTRHHTVSRPSNGATPTLALCKSGRADVPGPLCNTYGGYDQVMRILCMAWANHPGAGGPVTLRGPYGAFVVPENVARPYLFGCEFEGGLEPWTASYHDFMARASAAELEWVWSNRLDRRISGEDLSGYQTEHKTWAPDRKVDRYGYTTDSGRAATRAALLNPTEDDDMPLTEADYNTIASRVSAEVWNAMLPNQVEGGEANAKWLLSGAHKAASTVWTEELPDQTGEPGATAEARWLLSGTHATVTALSAGGVDVVALAAAIVAAMNIRDDLTPDEVQTAVEAGVRKVLGGLDQV